MNKYSKALYILLLLPGLRAAAQREQSNPINITTTAVPFLRISPDARSGALGETGMATSPDVNSVFNNMSKLVFHPAQAGVSASYSPWLKQAAGDMYLASLAGFYRLADEQVLTGSVRYFSLGNVPVIDYSGNEMQNVQPREFSIDAGYARKLSNKFGIGLAFRYIHSKLLNGVVGGDTYQAGNAVAGDLSLYYNGLSSDYKGWTAGLALSNLGTKFTYNANGTGKLFLPATLKIGGAYTESWDSDHRMTLAGDFTKLLVPKAADHTTDTKAFDHTNVAESWINSFEDISVQVSLGAEYMYKHLLSLRLGYQGKGYLTGQWQSFSAGLGLQLQDVTVNFCYQLPLSKKEGGNPLNNTLRFGILYHWNK